MSHNRENFRLWYSRILEELYRDGNAGFAILIIALPLLERYLREKSGVHEAVQLDTRFYSALRQIFPALQDDVTATHFWHIYRNGLLHQVTLSQSRGRVSMPDAWVSSKVAAVTVDQNGDFWVHPAKLAKIVVDTIEADFTTFEGGSSISHPFPVVHAISDGTSSVPLINIPATGAP